MKHLAILLATYNGEAYLDEQLHSLLNQSYKDWALYIHDDGSSDGTVSIIKRYADTYDNIIVLDYISGTGAKDNFLSMLAKVDADYYMFCDQDDVWLENKIEISLQKMKELEVSSPSTPIVVCSDLYIVDRDLHVTSSSYWNHAGIYPQFINNFNECAASSVATGCTMLFNREAKNSAIIPAKYAAMHDSWVALCSLKKNGILYGIDQPLVLYRQHGTNSIGATDTGVSQFTLAYRIRHFGKMFRQNKEHYLMLRSLGYGSFLKYIKYKIIYKQRIRQQVRQK